MVSYDQQRAINFFADRLSFILACSALKSKIDSADDNFVVLDARHEDVYSESRIPNATFIDADNLDMYWEKFSKDKINVIYCYSELCHRAARVCLAAAQRGYKVMELHAGFEGWAEYPMPLETNPTVV